MKPNPTLHRRQLIKILAASGGSLAAANLLPGRWVRPEIAAGWLPAHAQSTQPGCTLGQAVGITATTSTQVNGEYVDIDLQVRTPDGTLIAPASPGPHQGALHYGDNIAQSPHSDSESVAINGPVNGTYQVGVRVYIGASGGPVAVMLSIFSGDCIYTWQRTILDDAPDDPMYFADLIFPQGLVVERSGPFGGAKRATAGKDD